MLAFPEKKLRNEAILRDLKKMSVIEVASIYNISRQRVYKIEKKQLNKKRKQIRNENQKI